MLAAGAQVYTYTPFHLVATATVGGAVTTYRYDGDNQRRLRERPGGTKDYFIPGPGLVPLAEYRKASGGPLVLVREYIYAGDRLIASVGLEPSPLPAVTWTDSPLVANVTPVKAVHLTELRDAVNAARTTHGLAAVTWTNATVAPGVLVIQPLHVVELRTALNAVYVSGGVPPSYTDPALTEVRAVHLNELRAARTNAPGAEATATRFYHLDALGSVRAVTDQAGAEARRHDYAPFGEEPTPVAGADARRFTGKERDVETGLDYFSARYYHSGTGRFTTVDPLMDVEKNTLDPQQWNRYAYARNNPLKYIDRNGEALETLWDIFNVGLGVSSLVKNVREGKIGSAIADAGGILIDGVAAVVPVLPGGVGATIRAKRMGEAAAAWAFSLDDLARSANRYDRNGLTAAGRSLQKHGSRPSGAYPRLGHRELNDAGQEFVEEVLTDPKTFWTPNKYGGRDYFLPDGRGVRYDDFGNFMGFVDPPRGGR